MDPIRNRYAKKKCKTVAVYLEEGVIEEAYVVGEGNLSLGVRKLIERGRNDSANQLAHVVKELEKLLKSLNSENLVTKSIQPTPIPQFWPTENKVVRDYPTVVKEILAAGPMEKQELIYKMTLQGIAYDSSQREIMSAEYLEEDENEIISLIPEKPKRKEYNITITTYDEALPHFKEVLALGEFNKDGLYHALAERGVHGAITKGLFDKHEKLYTIDSKGIYHLKK